MAGERRRARGILRSQPLRRFTLVGGAGDQHDDVAMRGKNPADQLGKAVRHPTPVWQELAGVRIDQHQTILSRIEWREVTDALENVAAGACARLNDLDIDLIVA